jgi:SAM-dependent methyltransferase
MRRVESDLAEAVTAVLLDVRAEETFSAGHLTGSGNIPRGEFEARRTELPPRDTAVTVVSASGAEAEAAAADLERLGYSDVRWLDAPLAALPGGLADRGPGARLWRPAPFLEEVLPLLPRGRALDVASGSGRDAVYLALNGFEVEAWDHDPEALARARGLAARHGVTLTTVLADLERRDPPLPAAAFDAVVCFRFLHRPLFADLERTLKPGGMLVVETYRRGQERFGRPKQRRFLLEPGELASAFPGLTVTRYEEPEPEGGPVTARLLARRP